MTRHALRPPRATARAAGRGLIAAVLLGLAAAGQAQVSRTPPAGGAAADLARLGAERNALQTENASLKAELQKAKSDLAAAVKDRDAAVSRASGSGSALAQARAATATAEASGQQYKQKLDELVGKYRDLAESLRTVEADRTKATASLATAAAERDACIVKNADLYAIATEVLDRYEGVGLFHRAALSEPFTKLARTRLENAVDDYRARAAALRVATPAAAPAATR
jgi:DNA repair exonuclease SbcCD ATPase subunit